MDFLTPVSGLAQSHLHIGLPAAQPDISHQHVVKFNVLRPIDDEGVWFVFITISTSVTIAP